MVLLDVLCRQDRRQRDAACAANFAGDRVDYYIRCSMKNAFTKILESGMGDGDGVVFDRDDEPGVVLTQLARDTEQLTMVERRSFSQIAFYSDRKFFTIVVS
ncbi:uncharacterized protein LOC107303913 [Oryza brachyantha]|uniref:uncharacterized protein LOC107303913 n=1 Tax=Oryza brachyantha TaxID=4533 RepID=UPI0007768CFF|nr:uncharacterized protein LOC107303913 [Oryza brachyantha]